jgi:diaminopropionate ammonia-lyase
MMSIWMYANPARKAVGEGADLAAFSPACAGAVRRFHSSFKEYKPTALTPLPGLAAELGLKDFLVKDESSRYGLKAFKVLGASYAVGRFLAARLGRDMSQVTRDELCSPEAREKIGDVTFVTTTDGNHGRGLAWTARELGYKAIVFMPKGSTSSRMESIRAEGASCTVTELNYDEAVRMTWALAQEKGYVMVQDTAWEGYTEIPTWISQGYMTLAQEALEQMRATGTMPTHCFLQAGVGSFASAVVGHLTAALGAEAPRFVIVEPHTANCIYRSAVAGDGKPRNVTGDLQTLMAGLACGEPNTVSWGILRDYASAYFSCPDYLAANGMRILAAPTGGDAPIVSGESGAVTTGLVHWLMRHPAARAQRDALGLGADSRVLVVSTEGDTAPEIYKGVVWGGAHPDVDGVF